MKYEALRYYIKNKNLQKSHSLQDCNLVIDANSYFKDSYKNSECEFILGPESDRYADYLVNKLASFLEANIKCYVIFKGTKRCDLEETKNSHQKLIDDRRNIGNMAYFEPLFVKDIQKQVLKELGIRYFCCEYDSMDAIVGVAKSFKCPVLTHKYEYCLFGVSCIQPNSVSYDTNNKVIQCNIYDFMKYRASFGVYNKTPLLLTVLNECIDTLNIVPELAESVKTCGVYGVIRWVKRQSEDGVNTISKNFNDENQSKAFLDLYEKIKMLYLYPSCNLAVRYFKREKPYKLFKDDNKWFSKGVSNGRIELPYVDLKRKGLIIGSTLINNEQKPDALLAATQIIAFAHSVLTNSQKSSLKFIGRKNSLSSIWDIDTCWNTEICKRDIFAQHRKFIRMNKMNSDLFSLFFKEVLPDHPPEHVYFVKLPEDCWILVQTLVYYIHKVNKEFMDGAYFVLLSYLMLGPISKRLDAFKNNGESVTKNKTFNDYQNMYSGLNFLFRKVDLNHFNDTNVIHSLAEFQHCLQQMNYLNKLCGETIFTSTCTPIRIPCTLYHDTYNSTFVYNCFLRMKTKDTLMSYLENQFKETESLNLFKSIVAGFEACLNPTSELKRKDELTLQFSSTQ